MHAAVNSLRCDCTQGLATELQKECQLIHTANAYSSSEAKSPAQHTKHAHYSNSSNTESKQQHGHQYNTDNTADAKAVLYRSLDEAMPHDDLLAWSSELDFDGYCANWKCIATSGPSEPWKSVHAAQYHQQHAVDSSSVHAYMQNTNNSSSSSYAQQ
eukprot:9806-Heterococcus_DN1.PRE.1